MRCSYLLSLAGLAVLLPTTLGVVAHGDTYAPRQYYGSVRTYPGKSYSYRPYYYKPTPTYSGYKHQYVLYYPSRPKYAYFYNPYKKQFWGRCHANTEGNASYSMLPESERKANIEDIDEKAFPPAKAPPPVPESNDGATMELPPDDLPTTAALPKQ